MKAAIVILVVLAALLFFAAWLEGRRATNPDDYGAVVIPGLFGAALLALAILLFAIKVVALVFA